ncbi:MAG TPA: cytochrome c [Alphaproteobacteria bacterium]|nr:cytochrome c [Alphaproteobacteria bacterium]
MPGSAVMPARERAPLALAAMIALAAPVAHAGGPSESRQAELIYRLRQDCGSCHGYTLKGGLGPSLLPAALKGKDDDTLVHVILHGMPGRPMPPWSFEVSRDEAFWLVRRMKMGLKNER